MSPSGLPSLSSRAFCLFQGLFYVSKRNGKSGSSAPPGCLLLRSLCEYTVGSSSLGPNPSVPCSPPEAPPILPSCRLLCSLCSSRPGSARPQHHCSSVAPASIGSKWKLLKMSESESPIPCRNTLPQHCATGARWSLAEGVPPPGSPYIQSGTCCAHHPVKETSVLSPSGPGQK